MVDASNRCLTAQPFLLLTDIPEPLGPEPLPALTDIRSYVSPT